MNTPPRPTWNAQFPNLPPIWWLGCVLAIVIVDHLALFGHMGAGLRIAGLGVFGAAVGLFFWATRWFRRKKTTFYPAGRPKALIVEGPFRISRNPIYLAMVASALGLALMVGSWLGCVLAMGLWWQLDRRFAWPEEAYLRDIFGSQADTYITQTRRWL